MKSLQLPILTMLYILKFLLSEFAFNFMKSPRMNGLTAKSPDELIQKAPTMLISSVNFDVCSRITKILCRKVVWFLLPPETTCSRFFNSFCLSIMKNEELSHTNHSISFDVFLTAVTFIDNFGVFKNYINRPLDCCFL
ncbi:hypothetical protein TRFO_28701 [Tritrichomonas foetus]|uniref:Uncharacterized protein n=1 Tax=Tritrichomonas foetus TaxID=1144522 RepID=A0A1J4JY55_9EUKA|nr:hypothetical protein TRFO_28701 [Tritrichomonas foetus]|eukprot:OHT03923.1 hypothetical protein TRFO_28701 [Tritrichomonas foetus]